LKPRSLLIRLFALLLSFGALAALYSARQDIEPHLRRAVVGQWRLFEKGSFPADTISYLYDMGVVDANNDRRLDLFTSNHNYRQFLFLASSDGGFHDALTEWGLDQNPSMPGIEQANTPPPMDRPGLYIYWIGDTLHLRFHKIDQLGPARGSARFYNLVKVVSNDGVSVSDQAAGGKGPIPESRLDFAAATDGHVVLYLFTRGAPMRFHVDAPWARTNTFVGERAVVPPANTSRADSRPVDAVTGCEKCLDFEMALLDRHSMVWSDLNHDGQPDVFINRGALGGSLRSFPAAVRDQVADELLISDGPGRFAERGLEQGIQKKDCSGRHARWVDFDRDGRLDLFINCQDRGHVPGGYSKQFYRQRADGHFEDVAAQVGLALADKQIVDLVWFDADGDGRIDMFTHEDTGYYLYRWRGESFDRELVHVGPFHRANVKDLPGNTTDYWQFDGKLSVMDIDGDGHLDVLVASKRGNVLLMNGGAAHFRAVNPTTVGLPAESVAAAFVDYDNDGRVDLHVVPEGIYRQTGDGRFERTGLLAVPDKKYQAAIVNWFDRDNDGAVDLVMALQENASLWRWWDRLSKSDDVMKGKDDRFDWSIESLRNKSEAAHWLQLKLVGRPGNAEAIGARVTLKWMGGLQARQVGSHEGSYLSQGHYRLYFGLGVDKGPVSMDIVWPDGQKQSLDGVAVDQLLSVTQPG
jgi:hypothetical protein